MGQQLQELLAKEDLKDFTKSFKELETEWKSPGGLLESAVADLPLRTWENYYVSPVSQAFFVLMSGKITEDLYPSERIWWPFLQALRMASTSRLHDPYATPLRSSERGWEGLWKLFEDGRQACDFSSAYSAACTLLDDSSLRERFRSQVLLKALEDSAFGGLKFIHLSVSFAVAESLGWKHSERLLFPALHLMICGETDTRQAGIVKELTEGLDVSRLDGAEHELAGETYEKVEDLLLQSGRPEDCRQALSILLAAGAGWDQAREALLAAAAQSLTNSRRGHWTRPLIALLNTWLVFKEASRQDRSTVACSLLHCARLIQAAAQGSKEGPANRKLDELITQLCPANPLGTLRDVVSHSDPYAAATCVYPVLRMDPPKANGLFEGLSTLAAKNAGNICNGLDLLLVKAAQENFTHPVTSVREKLPLACAFFLGRVPKDYDLIGAYGV